MRGQLPDLTLRQQSTTASTTASSVRDTSLITSLWTLGVEVVRFTILKRTNKEKSDVKLLLPVLYLHEQIFHVF